MLIQTEFENSGVAAGHKSNKQTPEFRLTIITGMTE